MAPQGPGEGNQSSGLDGAVTWGDEEARADGAILVAVASIIAAPEFQVREKLDRSAVRAYAIRMGEGEEPPPLTLARIDGKGGLFLIDGWHRREAALLAGVHRLPAKIIEATHEGAAWEAARLNCSHGVRLRTQKEKQAAFAAYMKARQWKDPKGKPKSLRRIAADLGGNISHQTVARWLEGRHKYVWRNHYDEGPRASGEGEFDPAAFHDRTVTQAAESALVNLQAAHEALSTDAAKAALRERLRGALEELEGGQADDF